MKIEPVPQSRYGRYYCGPTCLSMILCYYKINKSPLKIYSIIKNIRKHTKKHLDEKINGYTYLDEHTLILRKLNFKLKKIKKKQLYNIIKSYVKNGIPLLVNTTSFRPNKNYEHFVVIKDYKNRKIYFNDPESIRRKPIKVSKFMKKVKSDFNYSAIAVYK